MKFEVVLSGATGKKPLKIKPTPHSAMSYGTISGITVHCSAHQIPSHTIPAPQTVWIFPLGEAQVHTQARDAVVIVVTGATSLWGAVHSLLSVLQGSGQLSWQCLVLAAFPHWLTLLFLKEGKVK